MRVLSIAAAGASVVCIALTLTAIEYREYFAIGAMLCSAVALVTIVVGWRGRPAQSLTSPRADRSSAASVSVSVDAALNPAAQAPIDGSIGASLRPTSGFSGTTAAPVVAAISGEADVVGFLATLQDKGRLVDFLQDDITGYSDAQVGAAARVVHQGCKTVLNDYFRVVPVRPESEGANVTVPAGYVADEYRLVGKIGGEAPFSGTLMHRGWKAEAVRLPRVLRPSADRFPTIAPAEVELR